MAIRSLKPSVHVYNNGDIKYRGGVVWSTPAPTTTIRLRVEENMTRDLSVSLSLIPVDARTLGCPVACRVTGSGASDYVIVEILGSTAGTDAPANNAAAVAAGRFCPGIVPRSITNAGDFWWVA